MIETILIMENMSKYVERFVLFVNYLNATINLNRKQKRFLVL